jgi:hypothetical protein
MMLAMGGFLLAGGAGALGLPDASKSPPEDYAYRNGKVIIGGDVVVLLKEYVPRTGDVSNRTGGPGRGFKAESN